VNLFEQVMPVQQRDSSTTDNLSTISVRTLMIYADWLLN